MRVQWLLMTAALLLTAANLPGGDKEKPKDVPKREAEKPQQAKPKFYAKVEICGTFREQIGGVESRRFPTIEIPSSNPDLRDFIYPLDLSKLKGYDRKDRKVIDDKQRRLNGHTVRVTGALTEVKVEPFGSTPQNPQKPQRRHMVVVETLEDLGMEQGKVIIDP